MSGQVGALLRAGLALKLTQVKLAATSYVEDRTDHGKDVVKAYAIGAGFYAAAGLFLVAALLVAVGALFHYIEITYGSYTAFAVAGGVLVLLAIVAAAIAAVKIKPPVAKYPGLMDRLRVAITGKRVKSSLLPSGAIGASAAATQPVSKRAAESRAAKPTRNAIDAARSTAAEVLRSPTFAPKIPQGTPAITKAGAALAVTMLGWALARRFGQTDRDRA
ncbi:MAG: conserved rane protein of unknown function [Tardiphaga sp.]|nr:conserved rane protein of unknown function [Tardiphaga sp.]